MFDHASPLAITSATALVVLIAASAPAPVQANVGTAAPMCSTATMPDPFALYGDDIRFRVLRNGAPVGEHRVSFRRQGADLLVDTRFEVAVDVLFITAYRFRYEARDVWRNGCLVDMRVAIDDDGKRYTVSAEETGGALAIAGPKGTATASLGLFPTHHWHAGVLDETRVLNTITGRVTDVRIEARGRDSVAVNGQPLPARAFAYTGELQTEIWYDDQGRWVKMRFAGQDGSTIEYVCETCRLDRTASQ